MVRRANSADVAALAELQNMAPDKLAAYTDWVAAHAQTHLPFVAEADEYVVGATWLLVVERVPRQRLVGPPVRRGPVGHGP